MPRLPINFSRTVIYRISCNDLPDFIYVGSTTDFIKRKNSHKAASKTKDFKLYQTIRENGNWDNWRMYIIEEYPDCKNVIEQRIREQKWIDELNANLNCKNAYITDEERKDQRKENSKEYREQNKDALTQKQKEYRKQNKDELNQKRREYREQNKEKLLQQRREYKEQNKEKIAQQRKEYYEKTKSKV